MQYLARAVSCRSCSAPAYLAFCRDGRWRLFGRELLPAAPIGVWAWRRRVGMEETELAPGYALHFCRGHFGTDSVVPRAFDGEGVAL